MMSLMALILGMFGELTFLISVFGCYFVRRCLSLTPESWRTLVEDFSLTYRPGIIESDDEPRENAMSNLVVFDFDGIHTR
jgi:hypothetical protein